MFALVFAGFLALSSPSGATAAALPVDAREGTIEIMVGDDFDSGRSRTEYFLVSDGERIPLAFDAAPPTGWRTGDAVRVEGSLAGETLVVRTAQRLAAERSEREDVAAPSAWTTGPKQALVILVNFVNDTSQPYTLAQAQSTVFGASGSVAAYYSEVSFGNTSISGTVTNWLTLPINKPTTCDYSTIGARATTAATSAGYNLANYQFPIYVFPHINACGWAGLAYVGAGGAWINAALSTYVVGHEVGHNYGLEHAHSYDCGASAFAASCSRSEYGDPFDIMGGNSRHFNAYSKQYLTWLPIANVVTLSTGATDVNLSPIEASSGTRAIQLQTTKGRTYWIEARQSTGFDTGLSGNAVNGVLIRLAPSAVGGTDLLDATPDGSTSSASFGDAAVAVGQSFIDAEAGLTVTTTAKNGSAFAVHVDFGTFPPPLLSSVSPPSGSSAGGTAAVLTGSNFLPAISIAIGGVAAGATAIGPASVSVKTGAHAVGDVDAVVTNADGQSSTLAKAFFYDFSDVPAANPFHSFVVKLFRDAITAGCGTNTFCPASSVTRGQMAVFLLRSKGGAAYTPPACTVPVFSDVPCSSAFAAWINELSVRGVTAGCGGGLYCTTTPVTRGQMAVLLLRTSDGSSYVPPACTTAPFSDVPCSNPLAIWIQELVARGITAGCGSGNYCPNASATRGQMAVFLVATFGLP